MAPIGTLNGDRPSLFMCQYREAPRRDMLAPLLRFDMILMLIVVDELVVDLVDFW
jgi:hypothetical protein